MKSWIEILINLVVIIVEFCANILSDIIKNKIWKRKEDAQEQISFNRPPQFHGQLIGRKKDIQKVRIRLKQNKCVWISSIGGMGKSTLAMAYARKYRLRYHRIFWMSWKGSLEATLENKVNIQTALAMEPGEIYNQALYYLREKIKRTSLVIIDGLDNYTVEEIEIINSFHCKVLITSRRKSQDHIEYHLEGLSDAECKKMFCYHSLTEISSRQMQTILEVTGKHTLCIKLLARYARVYSVDQLFDEIIWFDSSDLQHSIEIIDGEPNMQIMAYFTQIYRITCEEDKKQMLLNLSLLPAEDLKLSEIELLMGKNVCSVVIELEKLGWLIWRDNQSVYLHPILAKTIRQIGINEAVDSCIYRDMLMKAANLTAISMDDFDDINEKVRFLRYNDSIISYYPWEDMLIAQLIINSVCIKCYMGKVDDWSMSKVETAIAILKKAAKDASFCGEYALQYARALTDLSECYYKSSCEKAIDMERTALEIKNKLADNPCGIMDMLKSYSNLMLYHHTNFMNNYIDIAESIMVAYENDIPHYKRTAVNIYNHYGLLLRSNGRRTDGILYLEKARAVIAANGGKRHSMYPKIINTLGAMYAELLRDKKIDNEFKSRVIKRNALKYLYQGYFLKRKHSKRTSTIAVSLHNLATTWFILKHKYIAWFYEHRALRIRTKIPEEELYLASSLHRIGCIYWEIYNTLRNKYCEVKGPIYLHKAYTIYKEHSEKDKSIDCTRELYECEKYLSYFACAKKRNR